MRSLKVSEYMNRHPITFTSAMPIEDAVHRLLSAQQSGGPVINENREVIGFLSEQDCIMMMLEGAYHQEQSATVADCMTAHEPVTVSDDMAIVDLAQQLGSGKPKLFPVVDEFNRLVGAINRTDILRAIDLHLSDAYGKH
ncbi:MULTISPECIES: CBS domain-containing protein [Gammaproteobacteria]|uniref:CBS domain-containing protein n=1 Tax=Gammaproteobacteria TaxID=1236 RepID=UPI000DCF8122|nr:MULTISPECIES: CBS domain-containing protein [Gammaproteobacteria]RTE87306.1 CBS domain-containing protein [Aliidiomarina sp. B3213]TCZ92908.1 CBS domain-containing protein [Lysobacter sp. N42]